MITLRLLEPAKSTRNATALHGNGALTVIEEIRVDVIDDAYDRLAEIAGESEVDLRIGENDVPLKGVLLDKKQLHSPPVVAALAAPIEAVKASVDIARFRVVGMTAEDRAAFDALRDAMDLSDLWARAAASRGRGRRLLVVRAA